MTSFSLSGDIPPDDLMKHILLNSAKKLLLNINAYNMFNCLKAACIT